MIIIGEILWDIFPEKKVLGGSPFNLYYNLNKLKLESNFISRVGLDSDGEIIQSLLKKLKLNNNYLQQDDEYPTGKVNVTVNNQIIDYEISEPAAWDNISFSKIPEEIHQEKFNLAFSSLAQRNKKSRETIMNLAKKADKKFYDANLREPFTTKEIVLESLEIADVVKLNENELMMISNWLNTSKQGIIEPAKALQEKFDLEVVAITRGENGSILIADKNIIEHKGYSVKTIDTVGAGDAFFAYLIFGYLKGYTWEYVSEKANWFASETTKHQGAIF